MRPCIIRSMFRVQGLAFGVCCGKERQLLPLSLSLSHSVSLSLSLSLNHTYTPCSNTVAGGSLDNTIQHRKSYLPCGCSGVCALCARADAPCGCVCVCVLAHVRIRMCVRDCDAPALATHESASTLARHINLHQPL